MRKKAYLALLVARQSLSIETSFGEWNFLLKNPVGAKQKGRGVEVGNRIEMRRVT